MPEDGYVVYSQTTTGTTSLQIDGVTVSVVARTGASGANWAISSFSGFVKQGSVLTISSGVLIELDFMKVFGFA